MESLDRARDSTDTVADKMSLKLLKIGYMKKGTEAIITPAQDQALMIHYDKHVIFKQDASPKCRIGYLENESAMLIGNGCEGLRKRQLKGKFHTVGMRVNRNVLWEVWDRTFVTKNSEA